jgi:hypothetical protein
VLEDCLLEPAQACPGVHAELVGQVPAGSPVRLEGVGLPAGPVQREHQLGVQPLPKRVSADQRVELLDELATTPRVQVGVDAVLQGGQPHLLQPPHLGLGEGEERHVIQGRAAKQRQSLPEQLRCHLGTPLGMRPPSVACQPPEPVEVKILRIDPQHVARRARDERGAGPRLVQGPPQPGHIGLDRVRCGGRGLAAPQAIDQAVPRDHLIRMQQEEREEGALLRPTQRYGPVAIPHLERAQQQKLHAAPRPAVAGGR